MLLDVLPRRLNRSMGDYLNARFFGVSPVFGLTQKREGDEVNKHHVCECLCSRDP